jgi:hypothetical protein
MNVSFWPVVPSARDHRHRSGILSAAFLALTVAPVGRQLVAELIRRKLVGEPPYKRLSHLGNIVRDPLALLVKGPWFLWRRKFARPALPGFFVSNRARRYGLEFHSEQWPNPDCRIVLGQEKDALGLPRLRINYHFTDKDTRSIVKAHDLFDQWLRNEDLGRLDYRYDRAGLAQGVLEEANHGVHQIGTIRMAATSEAGVVDEDGKAFGTRNLYVAGTAILPTSGQANPTFTAALLAFRLADHLGRADG